MVVVLLPRTEDLVARRDLVGVQHPFTVIAQRRRPAGDPPERVDVADLQIRPVDRERRRGCGRRPGSASAHGDGRRRRRSPPAARPPPACACSGSPPCPPGPSTSACTRGPAAIASMLVSPWAFSICASIPMRPTGSPCVASSWLSSRSSAWTCETSVTLGSTTMSSAAPAVDNHLDDVGVGPRRRPVVDPHAAQLARPARLAERGGDLVRASALASARRRPRDRGTPRRRAVPWPSRSSWGCCREPKGRFAGVDTRFPQLHSLPFQSWRR